MGKVIAYDLGCEPDPSTPAETLVQNGWDTFLFFFAVRRASTGPRRFEDLGVAVVRCEQCTMSRFGYPNDEGLPEHPLYNRGMAECSSSVMEVLDSSWGKEVYSQRRISAERIWGARQMSTSQASSRIPIPRHFVVALKEATFECLADSMRVERICASFDEAFAYVRERIAEH